jgi:hypothetical protein
MSSRSPPGRSFRQAWWLMWMLIYVCLAHIRSYAIPFIFSALCLYHHASHYHPQHYLFEYTLTSYYIWWLLTHCWLTADSLLTHCWLTAEYIYLWPIFVCSLKIHLYSSLYMLRIHAYLSNTHLTHIYIYIHMIHIIHIIHAMMYLYERCVLILYMYMTHTMTSMYDVLILCIYVYGTCYDVPIWCVLILYVCLAHDYVTCIMCVDTILHIPVWHLRYLSDV